MKARRVLIALAAVLVLLAYLVTVANRRSNGPHHMTILRQVFLYSALEEYRAEHGEYPTQELRIALADHVPAEEKPGIWQDQWGNDFQYERNSRYTFHFYSLGPDGEPGTGDEIGEHKP